MPFNRSVNLLVSSVVVALIAGSALASSTFRTRTGDRVTPVEGPVFEVVTRSIGAGGAEYWCAASDFVVRGQNMPWNTDITIVRGRAPSVATNRSEAVLFTTDAAASGLTKRSSSNFNAIEPGITLSAQRARTMCNLRARGLR